MCCGQNTLKFFFSKHIYIKQSKLIIYLIQEELIMTYQNGNNNDSNSIVNSSWDANEQKTMTNSLSSDSLKGSANEHNLSTNETDSDSEFTPPSSSLSKSSTISDETNIYSPIKGNNKLDKNNSKKKSSQYQNSWRKNGQDGKGKDAKGQERRNKQKLSPLSEQSQQSDKKIKHLAKDQSTVTLWNKANKTKKLETDIQDTKVENCHFNIPKYKTENTVEMKGINYKNFLLLKTYVSANGLIFSKIRTKLKHKQQRLMSKSVKYARMLALIPYTNYHFF